MNAIYFSAKGGADSLTYGPVATPAPGAGEVLVRVRAAAVTPTELLWVPTWTTMAGTPRPFPIIPGHEFSGVVHSLGAGVTGVAVGDVVIGMNDWFSNGTHAEFCLARAEDVSPKPATLDHAAAAAVPISALTAWQGLVDRAKLSRGERVLIHGAAGGVGLFAVQIARELGAHVVATASQHNSDFLRELGANEIIDYHAQPFDEVVNNIDVVFDTVGGDTLSRSWNVLRPGGRLVTIAAASEQTQEPRVKDAFFIVERSGRQLAQISKLIDAGKLHPVVDSIFPLADGRTAYAHKPVRGKVVITVEGA